MPRWRQRTRRKVLMATLSRRQVLNAGGAVVGAAALGVSLAASAEAVAPGEAFFAMWREVLARTDFRAGCAVLALTVAGDDEAVVEAAGDPTVAERTWVLFTETYDGAWGIDGHANTNEELVASARAQLSG